MIVDCPWFPTRVGEDRAVRHRTDLAVRRHQSHRRRLDARPKGKHGQLVRHRSNASSISGQSRRRHKNTWSTGAPMGMFPQTTAATYRRSADHAFWSSVSTLFWLSVFSSAKISSPPRTIVRSGKPGCERRDRAS